MAKFLETLAESGIVIDACDAAGKSSPAAYALRRREPLFAQAWELALGNARDRLADTLLARSIEGNVEQIIKDGEIVAEKHYLDNRLGLAILKRLDQRFPGGGRGPGQREPLLCSGLGPGLRRETDECDWDVALTALRTGDQGKISAALAMLAAPEVSEVSTPSIDEIEDGDAFSHPRVWREYKTDEWRTDFPPPPGFDGHQEDDWESESYVRSLTREELASLIAAGIADPDEAAKEVSIEEDEAERDEFFRSIVTPAAEPGSALYDAEEEKADAGSSPA